MFKRVEKRIRKKERDEELGLDGEMKEALGINDLNSDDESSDSDDSNDGSSDEDGDSEAGAELQEDGSDAEEGSELDEDEDVGEMDLHVGELEGLEEDASDADESEDEGEPPMSVSQALQNPLYIVSLDPEVRECIVCPGKLIKNAVMGEVHIKSNVSLMLISAKALQLTCFEGTGAYTTVHARQGGSHGRRRGHGRAPPRPRRACGCRDTKTCRGTRVVQTRTEEGMRVRIPPFIAAT